MTDFTPPGPDEKELKQILDNTGYTLDITPGLYHYENLPMQYTEIFFICKNCKFYWKTLDIFNIFAQNIDCGFTLELPRGGSKEYPQSMFWIKNKKIRYTPANPVLLYKSGV